MDKDLIYLIINKIALIILGYLISFFPLSTTFLLCTIAGLTWLYIYQYKKQKNINLKYSASTISKKNIMNKIGNLPSWIIYPDRERAEWLNEVILQLWPTFNNYFIKLLKGSIQNNIRKKFEAFRFEDIDFGCNPPKIDGVKVYNRTPRKDSIIIDFDVYYDGNCDINFSISGAQIGRIKDFQFSVEVRLVLKPLLNKMPLIGGVQIFFLNAPDINFALEGIPGIPGLSYFIRSKIREKLTKLVVFPNKITLKFSKSVEAFELKSLEPQGVLRVHLSEGKDLERKDVTGKSDPYAILCVAAQEYKTQVIKKSLNPKWDYWCEFIVLDPLSQHLSFKLFDEDDLNEDDFLGSGEVDIKSIVKGGKTDQWIKLDHVKHGEIHLRFTWWTLSKDYNKLDAAVQETKLLKIANLSVGLLTVFLDSIQDLPLVKTFRKPDAYCIIMVGKHKEKTKVKKHTVNPIWEQGFTFLVANPEAESVYVIIYDKHTDSMLDQFVYSIKNLSSKINLEVSKEEFPLAKNEPNSKIILSMQLRILTSDSFQEKYSSSSESEEEDEKLISSNLNNENIEESVEEKLLKTSTTQNLTKSSQNPLMPSEFQLGRLEITLKYSEPRQKLMITIHKICNLPMKDSTDIPDPYVKLKLVSPESSAKNKTKSIKDNCDPIYEETFEYLMSSTDLIKQKLIVTVKTVKKLFFNNNVIGQVIINFKNIDLKEPYHSWFDLSPVKMD